MIRNNKNDYLKTKFKSCINDKISLVFTQDLDIL